MTKDKQQELIERLQKLLAFDFGDESDACIDLAVAAGELTTASQSLLVDNERFRGGLIKARNKFLEYEQLHRLKNTPDGCAKAKLNRQFADELSRILLGDS